MLVYAILLVVFLVLSGFFSSSETAFLTIQRVRLEHLVRERVPGAARVATLLERPRALLSAILIGNNLVNTGAAAVGTAMATELLGGGEAVVAATFAITVLLVIFGEVIPKSLGLAHPFGVSRAYVIPLAAWQRLVSPAAWLLDRFSRALLRFSGGDTQASIALTPAELRTAIRLGVEGGTLEQDESRRMLGALGLEQRTVREIMVPRVDVVAIEADEPLRTATERFAETGFLRLPVFDDSPDEIIGYLHVSDVNAAQLDGRPQPVREVMRAAVFESEHASIARVLELMQQRATYLVMLVDEFGATSGLVTLEDITEEVVGELRSETGDDPGEDEVRLDEGRLVVEGGRSLADLSHDLGAELTDVDANTVAGLVLAYLRHFPRPGEHVDHGGFRFTVMESDERRVTRVAVEPVAAAESVVARREPVS